jgi:hydrogenase maturation protease
VTGRMLIAGVGNIFLGDDGFGVEVARRLAAFELPGSVRVADYGISGMHLAYDLAEGYETTILIDASPRGGEPGTVYVIEVDAGSPTATPRQGPAGGSPLLDAHGMQPDVVFSMLDMLGALSPRGDDPPITPRRGASSARADVGRVLVVGCEPASIDEGIGLSAPVAAAVDEAVRVVLDLVRTAGARTGSETVATAAADNRRRG